MIDNEKDNENENENEERIIRSNVNDNNLSEKIAEFISAIFEDGGQRCIQLRRKDLASNFDCVPSQINYVLRSRFTPERGFLIESQRGEHGYIQITKISCDMPEEKLEHVSTIIGDTLSYSEAKRIVQAFYKRELISMRERVLIELALKYLHSLNEELAITDYEVEMLIADMLERMLKAMVITDKEKIN